MLPGSGSTSAAEAGDNTVLTAGYLAGIQYTAWELCANVADSPGESISGAPFKSATLPDLAKVKVTVDGGSADEPFGGLSSSLLNRKKGDRYIIAIPPSILQRGTVDMHARQRPQAWMAVEIEIMKVKDGSKEKKEKKEKKSDTVATEQRVPFDNGDSPEKTRSNSIKDRMAALSQAGGGMQMGAPLQVSQPQLDTHAQDQQMQNQQMQNQQMQNQQMQNQQMQNQQMQNQQMQNQQMQNQQMQNQQMQNQQNAPQQRGVEPQYQQQQQYNSYQQQTTQHNMYGQQSQDHQGGYDNRYAVALVPGQEARSHFMGDTSQSAIYGRFPAERMGQGDGNNTIVQQTVSNIQSGVMQLNSKVDALMSMQGINPQMMGYMGNGMGSGFRGNNPSVGSMKGRGEEVIAMITSMVEEFDKKANSTSQDDSAFKGQIEKLEAKVETLQDRNEKLMQEKSDLLDRQSNMLQTSAASSAKTYELQHEVEILRREKESSEGKLSDLLKNVETLQRHASSGSQDRQKISELEADFVKEQNKRNLLEQTVSELREKASSEDEKWTQVF